MKNIKKLFKNIGIFTKSTPNTEIKQAVNTVTKILQELNCNIYTGVATLKKSCDLIIVIGGDGSFLSTTRKVVDLNIPIVGIHKGRLGFLADLSINNIKSSLTKILSGNYLKEHRSLLQATIIKAKNKKQILKKQAVNDIVLYNGKIPRLMEFKILINDQSVLQLRADGLIIATPTGSTAYSLSAGGSILYPTLKVFNLVPMSPHTLNARPLVINENSIIKLEIIDNQNNNECGLSFDGQDYVKLSIGDQININKYPKELRLIHPINYNYFNTLREKLGWS